jgi:N-acetylmuramoyl-L-alanine amidase
MTNEAFPYDKVTLFEFNRSDRGEPTITAYRDKTPIATRYLRNTEHLVQFIESFEFEDVAVRVAKTETEIIPNVPDVGVVDPELKGFKILLDAGHSKSQSGAHGQGPVGTRPNEYECNLLQAKLLKKELEAHGAEVTLFDPDPDNLVAVGQKASGHTIALFLHHNAANADGNDEGAECHIHPAGSSLSLKLGDKIATNIANTLKCKNRGVKRSNFTVLSESVNRCECCVLVESYFIDDYSSATVTKERSTKAAMAILDAILSSAPYFHPGMYL